MLKAGAQKLDNQVGLSRKKRREQSSGRLPMIKAKLVAARIGKPEFFSGWDLQKGGAKPTVAAVPAGSAYIFDCESPNDAHNLWQALHLRLRSGVFGEKGFGFGVCSILHK
jgi:CRISPR/Cas system CMR-associated protein Cmr3 (group 5 of RAMP superfamily)